MRMKRGGKSRKFGGTGKNLKLQTDNPKTKLFAQKNLNIKLFCKEIEAYLLQVFTWRVEKY